MEEVLVTGGAGFIGSHFVKHLLKASDVGRITVLDALTYAGHLENLGEALDSPRVAFVEGNILDGRLVGELMARCTAVVHFAAESHVDRSFWQAGNFLSTNVLGTQTLLQAAAGCGIERFVHVSTDEVYGPLISGAASEDAPLRPTVPYAASKAASDLVALSYFHTFGLPVCVTRSSNNYGPCQHPEKIIPQFVTNLLKGRQVHLHGVGQHMRNWLHVLDNCAAIELVLRQGTAGEVYNIGSETYLTNSELTAVLLRACGAGWDSVRYVSDRKANDLRYAMDYTRITQLGYQPQHPFEDGIAQTVDWYRQNPDRWAPVQRNPDAPIAQITLDNPPAAEEA